MSETSHQYSNHGVMIRIIHIIRKLLNDFKKMLNKIVIHKHCIARIKWKRRSEQSATVHSPSLSKHFRTSPSCFLPGSGSNLPRSSILILWILDISYNNSISSLWKLAPPTPSSRLGDCI